MSEDQLRPPANIREIANEWWDVLLEGSLWQVDMKNLPKMETNTFRYACLRKAAQRRRRVSIRFDSDGRSAFIQGGSLDDSMTEVRIPRSQAVLMPAPPAVSPKRQDEPISRQVNYDGIIETLLNKMDGEPITAAQLSKNPILRWFAELCNCGTENVRTHPQACPAYLSLPLFAHYLTKQPQSPEQWYFTRYVGPYAVVQETGYRAPAEVPSSVAEQVDGYLQDPATGVTRTRGEASRPVPEPVAEPAATPEEEDPEGSWTEHPEPDPEPEPEPDPEPDPEPEPEPDPEPEPEPELEPVAEPVGTGPQVQFTQQPDPVASTPIVKPPVGPMVINWDGHPS